MTDLWFDIHWLEDPTEVYSFVACDEHENYYWFRLGYIKELNWDDEESPICKLERMSVKDRNTIIKHEVLRLTTLDWKNIMRERLWDIHDVHGNVVGAWTPCNNLVGAMKGGTL